MRKRLSTKVVNGLPVKPGKNYVCWDVTTECFGIRVGAKGKRAVIFRQVNGRRVFKTLGAVCQKTPFEALKEMAEQELRGIDSTRPPPGTDLSGPTLRQVMEDYFIARTLRSRSVRSYRDEIERGFEKHLDQPAELLNRDAIKSIHRAKLVDLKAADPGAATPKGYWAWMGSLKALRVLLRYQAFEVDELDDDPWPRGLKIPQSKARRTPPTLRTQVGISKLMRGLMAMNTPAARACLFIAYTGLRRGEATRLSQDQLNGGVLSFLSKTRELDIPLSDQARALIRADGRLLGVSEWSLRAPLISVMGTEATVRGNRAVVTPHDLRRLFKSTGMNIGIDPTLLDHLVGHAGRGLDPNYKEPSIDALRTATQRIADALDKQAVPLELAA